MSEIVEAAATESALILSADAGLSDGDRLVAALDRIGERMPVAALLLDAAVREQGRIEPLRAVCRARGFACLVEATAVGQADGADGAVVAPSPRLIEGLRRRLGPEAIIGARCGLSRHEAMIAGEAGADFIGFEGQAGDDDALLERVAWWTEMTLLPCMVASPRLSDVRGALIGAGADFLAVPADLWLPPEAGPALDRLLGG